MVRSTGVSKRSHDILLGMGRYILIMPNPYSPTVLPAILRDMMGRV